jgi:Cytochrome C oxidase, cbb3-type, subunit III/Cytochrome c
MRRLLKVIGVALAVLVVLAAAGIGWLAVRSPEMRPATAEVIERTPERIARGEYLANHVMECFGCHSDHLTTFGMPIKPGTLGQGGFVFDEKFGVPGVVCAQNITPDKETGIGAWSDGEVVRATREGVTRDGRTLFPMMPYQSYRNMSDEDAKAIVAYLRTIPPIHHAVPQQKLQFPVNLLIKFEPKPVSGPVSASDDARDHLAYGKYLVQMAGCADCHTPRDAHGKPLPGMELAGGWEMLGPWGRVVTSNLTPDSDTFIGTATRPQFIGRFRSFADFDASNSPAAAPGQNTIMPWLAFSHMKDEDLGAIYDYLRTVKPIKHQVVAFPDAGSAAVAR